MQEKNSNYGDGVKSEHHKASGNSSANGRRIQAANLPCHRPSRESTNRSLSSQGGGSSGSGSRIRLVSAPGTESPPSNLRVNLKLSTVLRPSGDRSGIFPLPVPGPGARAGTGRCLPCTRLSAVGRLACRSVAVAGFRRFWADGPSLGAWSRPGARQPQEGTSVPLSWHWQPTGQGGNPKGASFPHGAQRPTPSCSGRQGRRLACKLAVSGRFCLSVDLRATDVGTCCHSLLVGTPSFSSDDS
jgi:hypothetical protein